MARSIFPTSGAERFPMLGSVSGWRTFLAVPLRQQGELIGLLNARRTEVRPFTPAQIKLLETFADQAVIAIENVRLFKELKESLEQQTATSEILGVIASSPTDIQPVLDVVAANAARLCDAVDVQSGASMATVSIRWPITGRSRVRGSKKADRLSEDRRLGERSSIARPFTSMISRRTFRLNFRNFGDDPGDRLRTLLATPLLREDSRSDVFIIRRSEARPFSDNQIALLETFADQAVIAIENVRLFKEIRNATRNCARLWSSRRREVLGIISQLADGCSAGARRHRRERGACLWDSTTCLFDYVKANDGFAGLT